MNEKWLEGKVAIVTGGGRGLGKAYSLALAQAGASVLVNDLGGSDRGDGVSSTPAQEVVDLIRAQGGYAEANSLSVAEWNNARLIVEDAIKHFGRLDILVNNAGISRYGTDIASISQEDWDITLAVNLTGTAAMCHWAAAHWREVGRGGSRAIVNTSSPAGVNPLPGSPAYCVSKAGVAALTQSSACELASLGVRVNALAPIARTRLTEAVPVINEMMGRTDSFDPYTPSNVAPLVVYLCSSRCRFTGRIFGIGGGKTYLFNGWSAESETLFEADRLSLPSLELALKQLPVSEHPYIIMPGVHLKQAFPDQSVLDALSSS
ncbi:SDR family NAD(P)-dependent oxidoreductase [Pseudomonas silesiensis]|uniref:SDR family NAD(P)-dependent oxidoreductase n=1 Tax=Pseudomonas silesiensis TaxID=1853130 RepID=UPI0034D75C5B